MLNNEPLHERLKRHYELVWAERTAHRLFTGHLDALVLFLRTLAWSPWVESSTITTLWQHEHDLDPDH